jgi:hypothetical protein
LDANNDGKINADDRVYSGSPFPDFTYGLNFHANYNASLLNAWTPNNKNTNIPRLAFNDPNNNQIPSTRFLYNASYLRVKNLQVGYTFSQKTITQAGISGIRLFVNARNLWTITKYPGYDPSYTNDGLLNRGLDQGLYPVSRIISGGIDINF